MSDKQCETVKTILSYGAPQDARDNSGRTPFLLALQNKNYGVMKELLKSGANINILINEKQETYLHLAIINSESPELVKFLLDNGADVNAKDIYGLSPIQKTVLTGDTVLLELLANNGADISARDNNGWSLLHCAARYGHADAVRWLLGRKVDVEGRSSNGRTALHFAAQHGQAAVAEILLDGGAKAGAKDDSGWTALRWANYRGHTAVVDRILDRTDGGETVKLLLKLGATVDEKNNFGETPFYNALQNNNIRIMWELKKGGANINLPLHGEQETYLHLLISQQKSLGHIQTLLDLGVDVNRRDGYGLTPIQRAACLGSDYVLELLYEYGANIFVRDTNKWSLLHCAASRGHTRVVEWLLEKRLDVNDYCDLGRTSLHYAAQKGHGNVVNILLNSGADTTLTDYLGRTPLRYALYKGHKHIEVLFNYYRDLAVVSSASECIDD